MREARGGRGRRGDWEEYMKEEDRDTIRGCPKGMGGKGR